ncbi:MAG: hypothetical protein ACW97P_00270 [Candidatus Hodarchaeales archaeon]|jgi:hypothetical protein
MENVILVGFIYLIAYLFVIFGGAVFVGYFLTPYKQPDSTGLTGAGRKIGMVERAIILTLALMGEFGTISFVFVAKSMARFEQLKKRQFAEYYLLGTLLSIFFAITIAIVVQGIITILSVTVIPEIGDIWNIE